MYTGLGSYHNKDIDALERIQRRIYNRSFITLATVDGFNQIYNRSFITLATVDGFNQIYNRSFITFIILENDLDIKALCEIWLKPSTVANVINDRL